MMKNLAVFFGVALLALVSCYGESEQWKRQVTTEVPKLGHRNMVIVADSAYPIQVGSGVRVINTYVDHLTLVRFVLELIDESKAVRPLVAVDKEFAYVPEEYAPGAAALRERILNLIEGKSAKPVREVLHEKLLAEVGAVSEDYEVVVFKSTGTIAYSSVFITLDCGYWSAEAEEALRERMNREK